MQRYEDTSIYDRLKGAFNHGTWRGGTPAWGRYRFWLKPEANTKTFGRDNFSVHGGWTPGSAGCKRDGRFCRSDAGAGAG
jgi:hypothetical protein